ncbi:hypothetical protein [Halorussus aquaticus]|uniref:C2H2-type domain-containing protein n=1 Tax=Halorussus aquaticus TaxID=2953748 RepID=A0ABD5PXW6_9EURY|nr:hypothetical protein [Halorussus aquaticus]
MAIQDRATQRRERQLLTACPACGEDLSGKTKTSDHFLRDHLPEDFGLTPLGEIREGTAKPLFEDTSEISPDSAPEKRVLADGGASP